LAIGNGTAADYSGQLTATVLDSKGQILITDGNGMYASAGRIILSAAGVGYSFSAGSTAANGSDTNISRLAAGSLAIGNGTAGDESGTLNLNTLVFPTNAWEQAGIITINNNQSYVQWLISGAAFPNITGTRDDQVIRLGWNLGEGGLNNPAEAGIGIEMEDYFIGPFGTHPDMEFHLVYYGASGAIVRFLTADADTVADIVNVASVSDSWTWIRRSDNAEIVGLTMGAGFPTMFFDEGMELQGANTTPTTTWTINSQTGNAQFYGSLTAGVAGVSNAFTINCLSTQGPNAFSVVNENGLVFSVGPNGTPGFTTDVNFGSHNAIFGSNQSIRINGADLGLASNIPLAWAVDIHAYDGFDSGISRLGPASLAIGNGTAGDFSGSLKLKSVLITDTAANPDLTVQNTTTATSSTTNASPLLELSANYWTGSASAADTWTIGSSLGAGTNGASTLSIAQSGSSGLAAVSIPYLISTLSGGVNTLQAEYDNPTVNGTAGFKLRANPGSGLGQWEIHFQTNPASSGWFEMADNTGIIWRRWEQADDIMASDGLFGWSSHAPLLGTGDSADTGVYRVSAGIMGLGLGSPTGNLQCASIALNGAVASPTAGIYYSGTNAGITQSAIAVGTIGTTGGIVTTFTGVSDERLKKFTEYGGGLAEILNIVPIRYRWNEAGQKKSGQTGDRDYVGFSAQNVQRSIPEAIQGTEGEEEYLSFDDRPVIAALVNAVKELKAEIEVLKARK
jgi:hypothetical protein